MIELSIPTTAHGGLFITVRGHENRFGTRPPTLIVSSRFLERLIGEGLKRMTFAGIPIKVDDEALKRLTSS